MGFTHVDILLAGIAFLVALCGQTISRQMERIRREATMRHATLESCRVLLKYIAENMQCGEKKELFAEAINDHIKEIFER